MKKNAGSAKQWCYFSIVAIIGLVAGFGMGRDSVAVRESITYIKGDTIHDSIELLVPYKVEVATNPQYIYKYITDTLTRVTTAKVDTVAIINDWTGKRYYSQNVFDNEYGKLSLSASVQYNKLGNLSYTFVPIIKQISVENKRTWTPFASASYNSLGYVSAGAGLFHKDLGVGFRYTTDFDKKGLDVELLYKF